MDEAMKQEIVDFIKKKTERGKGLSSYRDIAKGCPSLDRKMTKKAVQELIKEGVLDYWSSGSTTYIRLKGYELGDSGLAEGEVEKKEE